METRVRCPSRWAKSMSTIVIAGVMLLQTTSFAPATHAAEYKNPFEGLQYASTDVQTQADEFERIHKKMHEIEVNYDYMDCQELKDTLNEIERVTVDNNGNTVNAGLKSEWAAARAATAKLKHSMDSTTNSDAKSLGKLIDINKPKFDEIIKKLKEKLDKCQPKKDGSSIYLEQEINNLQNKVRQYFRAREAYTEASHWMAENSSSLIQMIMELQSGLIEAIRYVKDPPPAPYIPALPSLEATQPAGLPTTPEPPANTATASNEQPTTDNIAPPVPPISDTTQKDTNPMVEQSETPLPQADQ